MTQDKIERDTFALRLTERIAELEAQREKAPILDRVIINGLLNRRVYPGHISQ